MKKASINQTVKIAKTLGSESLSWSEKLSKKEADTLIERLQKPKKNYTLYFGIFACIILICMGIFVAMYIYKNHEIKKTTNVVYHPIYISKQNTISKEKILNKTTKQKTTKENIFSKIKQATPYTKKQVEYACFKTVELVNKIKPQSAVVVEKTIHIDNKIPLEVHGTVVENGKKFRLKSTFQRIDNKTKIEIRVDNKTIFSN